MDFAGQSKAMKNFSCEIFSSSLIIISLLGVAGSSTVKKIKLICFEQNLAKTRNIYSYAAIRHLLTRLFVLSDM